MTKSQNFCSNGGGRKADICKVCGKEGRGKDIRDHIETNHMRGTQHSVQLLWKNLQVKKYIRSVNDKHLTIYYKFHKGTTEPTETCDSL